MRNVFTLIDLILVMGIAFILAAIIIVAINPSVSQKSPEEICISVDRNGQCCTEGHEELSSVTGYPVFICDKFIKIPDTE